MARITLHGVGHELAAVVSTHDADRRVTHQRALTGALDEKLATVRSGWGPEYAERVRQKGKLTAWERIRALADEGTAVFEIGSLVNWGRVFKGSSRPAPGAGVITVFCRVHERWTVVVANDNTVASGAWWPLTPEKIQRAQQVARRLRLPIVYLVDCSGLFLPEQSRSFSGLTGAGHIFTDNARLAEEGVPQLAGVFGDCIAGGGYMPIISDHVVMTESAYMVIAGAALIKGAKSLHLTSLDIGGPEVHVHQSRCADERVPDDVTALRVLRDRVALLPTSAVGFYRQGVTAEPPRYPATDLDALFPVDGRESYDIEEVLARLVDHSLFHEFLPGVGREMITGVARVSGLWMGFVANRQGIVDEPGIGKRAGGALYREGIAKISTFARSCADDGIPLVWLQDISGFDIGVEAERLGLLGYGSNLIYTNSTASMPFFTILLRKASGAGYYAMSGLPYEPVVQLSTPLTRLAVMEGRTLAIATYNSKLDDDFQIATTDPEERRKIEEGMAKTAERIEEDMDPVRAASVMDTDEIVPVSTLRAWLEVFAETSWQAMGYRRTKNPRIWSLHDLEALSPRAAELPGPALPALERDDVFGAPTVGTWTPTASPGAALTEGLALGTLVRAGRSHVVIVEVAGGSLVDVAPAGAVDFGAPLGRRGTGAAVDAAPRSKTADAGVPEGVVAVRADTDGTLYLRPDPRTPPFVAVGQVVARQDTLGLVEVMKTFTPLRAPVAGVVEKLLAVDGAPVRAGQVLVWVRPSDPRGA
jgi:3-methylcrotonyl-CoA carboxylase beta subunit